MFFSQATAFSYPPRTTITVLPDGSIKYGGYEFLIFDAIASKVCMYYV